MAHTPRSSRPAGEAGRAPGTASAAGGAAKASGTAGEAAKKTVIRRRRSRRDNKLDPEAGWGLIGDAAGRLGLWEGLAGYLAQRAFALAVKQLVPRLMAHARAEELVGDTLVVRVSSSAVASELTYVRDLLLTRVNEQLGQLPRSRGPSGRRSGAESRTTTRNGRRPVKRLQHKVGVVAELPDVLEWNGFQRRPPLPRPTQPPPRLDNQVAEALSQVHDETLRRALGAMYAASLQERDPKSR